MSTAREKVFLLARIGAVLMLVLTGAVLKPAPAQGSSIVVDTTADDDITNGNCTLREAMIAARDDVIRDACAAGGAVDTISFNIDASTDPGCDAGTGVCTIQPGTMLPWLYGSGGITIDGYTQPGAAPATGSAPAEIRIEIDGSLIGASPYGIVIQSPNNVIAGLAINRFSSGIVVAGASATDNTIRGCYIGTDPTGTIDRGNTSSGIVLSDAGNGNLVGGVLPEDRNLISGNDWYGIDLSDGTTGATIAGNYIGTTADGLSSLPNQNGIDIRSNTYGNTVGGSAAGARNVISGNEFDGVILNGIGGEPHGNVLAGNYIGLDKTGGAALANGANGVQILNGAFANTIGPDNVISGNGQHGVLIWTNATNENQIVGNFIGTDSTGMSAVPNASLTAAVFINASGTSGGPLGTVIGGDTIDERNVIAGNAGQGVRISGAGTDQTVVSGNFIGLDATGASALLNAFEGVMITNNAGYTTVGGDTAAEGNVIVANNSAVKLDAGAHNNTISANLLGTDVTGTVGFGVGSGLSIGGGAHHNTIGGPTSAERNLISGNGGRGLNIYGSGTDFNQVLGNYIGVDITGANPLPNPGDGIRIWNSAQDNTIGPGNIIAHNNFEGVYIYGTDSDRNFITQNSIYGHTSWNIALGAGANDDLPAPEIGSVTLSPLAVSGTTTPACVGCTVEIFTSPSNAPVAGKTYLGSGTTDGSGNWTVSTPGLHGPYITATLTDASRGTSKFSTAHYTSIQALFLPLIMR